MATGKNKKKATTTKRDRKLGKDGRAEVDRLYAANPLMTEEEKKEEWKNNPLFKAAGKTLLAFEEGWLECDSRREVPAVAAARERRWAAKPMAKDKKWKAYHAEGGKAGAKARKLAAKEKVAAEEEKDDDDDDADEEEGDDEDSAAEEDEVEEYPVSFYIEDVEHEVYIRD